MIWNQLLRFAPLYQARVWGGRNLERKYGRSLPDPALPFGESWELCDRPGAVSRVVGGAADGLTLHDLWQHWRVPVFGEALKSHPASRFPLLLKILDAREDLSLQVHPPPEVAEALGGESKTEMWYVAQVEHGAKLYAGLRGGVDRADFEKALVEGTVAELMHVLHPQKGQALFLPSGRVHAIGSGLVIFEIQQNSDTTYRVFDWGRMGLDGTPRALHVQESLMSIRFDDVEPDWLPAPKADGVWLDCPYFQVRQGGVEQGQVGRQGEAVILAVTQGCVRFGDEVLRSGDFALMPAALPDACRVAVDMDTDSQWLEIRVPPVQGGEDL